MTATLKGAPQGVRLLSVFAAGAQEAGEAAFFGGGHRAQAVAAPDPLRLGIGQRALRRLDVHHAFKSCLEGNAVHPTLVAQALSARCDALWWQVAGKK